jgi:hypothetical protein
MPHEETEVAITSQTDGRDVIDEKNVDDWLGTLESLRESHSQSVARYQLERKINDYYASRVKGLVAEQKLAESCYLSGGSADQTGYKLGDSILTSLTKPLHRTISRLAERPERMAEWSVSRSKLESQIEQGVSDALSESLRQAKATEQWWKGE